MRRPPSPWLIIAVALSATAAVALSIAGGCVSKPPAPEAPTSDPAAPSHQANASTPNPSAPAIQQRPPPLVPPADPAAASAGPSASAAPAQTLDERRAALDKRFNDSLGSFDSRLRAEQQKVARERDARQTAVVTVASSSGDGNVGSNPPARSGDLKSDRSAGGTNGSAGGNGAVANEVPDGNDDDIVARRLRKAAEQETDPELKDKLWKEYVEYKRNTPGK